jgi:hypothetical protein
MNQPLNWTSKTLWRPVKRRGQSGSELVGDSEVMISMLKRCRSCSYAATVVRRCDGARTEGAVVSETTRNIAGGEPVRIVQ